MFLYTVFKITDHTKYFEFGVNNAILNINMLVLFYIKLSFNNVYALDS